MDQEPREIYERATTHGATNQDLETVIAIGSYHIADTNATLRRAVIDEHEAAKKEEEDRNSSCSINVNNLVEDNERFCRICHLSEKEIRQSPAELLELGCVCKGELGVAHLHCAEAWFRLKGNRLCEICGEAAKNITGVSDNGFMEEWSERRSADSGNNTSSDESRTCLMRQPICNLLLACLVLAFVLPWFLNLF